ncbi:Hypp205 [Branchiostoma lanceolatum]|uniref:Hypp205 protein n=1 Tax=Branchiostoma lanceolatum TaxID=7740 RepID=A0A8J9W2D2_BRALA|nr:Hypp205 [Branchiostoma lanceolatum]
MGTCSRHMGQGNPVAVPSTEGDPSADSPASGFAFMACNKISSAHLRHKLWRHGSNKGQLNSSKQTGHVSSLSSPSMVTTSPPQRACDEDRRAPTILERQVRNGQQHLTARTRQFLELCDLMSEESNYRLYQKALKHALKDSACVPLLGIFLQTTAGINSIKHVDPGQARERGETLTEREPADLLASMTEEEKKLVICVIRRWKEQKALRLEREAQRKINAERESNEMLTEEPKGWWQRKLNFRNSRKNVLTEPEAKKSWIGWKSDKKSLYEISVIKEAKGGNRTGEVKSTLWGQLLQDMPKQHNSWSSSFRSWGKTHHEDQSILPIGVSSHHHILDSDINLDHELEIAHHDDIHDNDIEVSRYGSVDKKRILAFAFGSADSDEDIPANLAHRPFEMLQQYQMSAVQYRHESDPAVRDFLLRADYNTETDNYRLSHEKEPSHNVT